jgi:hypothetical protein
MPLLYPVNISSSEIKWTWFTPIYWARGYYDEDNGGWVYEDMRLHALALVDASNIDKYFIQELGGTLSGAVLVQAARTQYVALFDGAIEPEPEGTLELSAMVVNKTSYVHDGDTHIVIGTDNSTYWYIEGTRDWMNITDWYTLISINVSEQFTATIQQVGDQFRIIAFVKE